MYVVVCQDMPISHQAVQASHASVSAGRDLITCKDPYLILVTVPDQNALLTLSAQLTNHDISHRVFFEDDMGGRATALATRPITQEQRKLFRSLPLYKVEEKKVAV